MGYKSTEGDISEILSSRTWVNDSKTCWPGKLVLDATAYFCSSFLGNIELMGRVSEAFLPVNYQSNQLRETEMSGQGDIVQFILPLKSSIKHCQRQ